MPKRRRKKKEESDVQVLDEQDLADLINNDKDFGPGTIKFASDPAFSIEKIPTGVLSVDWALGGGLPRGRHIEMYGPYGVGKTWLTYKTIVSAQAMGLPCAFLDAEHTMDPRWAAKVGIDLDKLVVHEQEYGQKCIDVMELFLRQEYGVVALDSIASLLPKEEADAAMEAASMGMQQAKMMSKALRKLTVANKKTTVIFLNQMRDAIGVMFGPRSTTTGGRSMAHYASVRIEMSRSETIKRKAMVIDPKKGDEVKQDVVRGHRVLLRIEKGKVSGAYTGTKSSFVFDYEKEGHDKAEDLMYIGRQVGLVHKKGDRWWVEDYEDEVQLSRERFRKWLNKNVAIQEELEQRIWATQD